MVQGGDPILDVVIEAMNAGKAPSSPGSIRCICASFYPDEAAEAGQKS